MSVEIAESKGFLRQYADELEELVEHLMEVLVDRWHDSDHVQNETLHGFMDLPEEELKKWTEDPDYLPRPEKAGL